MYTKELHKFLQTTYDLAKNDNWTLQDIIKEITLAGFDNEEIGVMMKQIVLNPTFLTCLKK